MPDTRPLMTTMLLGAVVLAGCSGSADRPTPSPSSSASTSTTLAERARAVEDIARPSIKAGVTPGLVAVVADDSGERTVALGVADREHGLPMHADTRFKLAGVTASMTAAMVLQLDEDRALEMGDTVAHWMAGLLPGGDNVTLEQVLAQTGGLPDIDPEPMLGDRDATDDDYVGLLSGEQLVSEPGEEVLYSNVGYALLGLVAEKATEDPLDQVLHERVFDPLGMTSTELSEGKALGPRVARGYEGAKDVTDVDVSWTGGAGAAVGTAPDADRFLRGLFGGAVVPREVLARMTDMRDVRLFDWTGYGLGLARIETDCGIAYGQTGLAPGYLSDVWYAPDTHRSVAVVFNSTDRAVGGTVGAIREAALCD